MEWIVTVHKIAAELLSGIRRAACLLTGAKRRCFQAEIATEYCNASPRQTETRFGFNRHAVKRGLLEKEAGKTLLQCDRALLGSTGETLERDAAGNDTDRAQVGPEYDLERNSPHRAHA